MHISRNPAEHLSRWEATIRRVEHAVDADIAAGDYKDGRRLHQRFDLYLAQASCECARGDFNSAMFRLRKAGHTYLALLEEWSTGRVSSRYIWASEIDPVLASLLARDYESLHKLIPLCLKRQEASPSPYSILSTALLLALCNHAERENGIDRVVSSLPLENDLLVFAAMAFGPCSDRLPIAWPQAISAFVNLASDDGDAGTPRSSLYLLPLGLVAAHRYLHPSCSCTFAHCSGVPVELLGQV